MGLLDRARAAVAAGKAEAEQQRKDAETAREMRKRAEEVAARTQKRMTEEEERRNPSRLGRAAGKIMYHGGRALEAGERTGGRLLDELDTFAKETREQGTKGSNVIGGRIVQRPRSEVTGFFNPTRRDYGDRETGSVRKGKKGKRVSRQPQSRRSITDIDFDRIF